MCVFDLRMSYILYWILFIPGNFLVNENVVLLLFIMCVRVCGHVYTYVCEFTVSQKLKICIKILDTEIHTTLHINVVCL